MLGPIDKIETQMVMRWCSSLFQVFERLVLKTLSDNQLENTHSLTWLYLLLFDFVTFLVFHSNSMAFCYSYYISLVLEE